jgi:arsenical pump membrane protein
VALLSTAGVVVRPWRLPEAVWAVAGAGALVALGFVSGASALGAIGRGTDVYLFLAGMMLIAELARQEGLFDRLAALAAARARGSRLRLFGLVYAVGTLVTVFLSNDATAVVLTPAVYVAARAVGAPPLPYLYVCAFIANAASFVLPISNPANLVVFGARMPSLGAWMAMFALPSALAVAATYVVLRVRFRRDFEGPIAKDLPIEPLTHAGRLTAWGTVAATLVLLVASAMGWPLGWPTFLAGAGTALAVLVVERKSPWPLIRGVSWSVLPLVAGLFVVVAALEQTGVVEALSTRLVAATQASQGWAAFGAGLIVGIAANLMNNLPAGLLAASTLASAGAPHAVSAAVLIGIDLGPNLSVTGSLATILWLIALRREGLDVGAWRFLKLGTLVALPALIMSLLAVAWIAT